LPLLTHNFTPDGKAFYPSPLAVYGQMSRNFAFAHSQFHPRRQRLLTSALLPCPVAVTPSQGLSGARLSPSQDRSVVRRERAYCPLSAPDNPFPPPTRDRSPQMRKMSDNAALSDIPFGLLMPISHLLDIISDYVNFGLIIEGYHPPSLQPQVLLPL